MTCPDCQHLNDPTAKFCEECGTALQLICPQCQQQNKPTAKFCKECGSKLVQASPKENGIEKTEASGKQTDQLVTPSTGSVVGISKPPKAAERRQLTCLFCDLAGSTALSEELDAEDFRQVILDYQKIAEQVIQQFGGHVAQYLGDGLLVYFGYPKGLENAPRAAVRAGLGILESVDRANQEWATLGRTEINIRIGIHSGLVVVDEQMALGETVNVAARLEGLAPLNTLVISPQTLKLVRGWFEVKSLGKEKLKGIREPIEVFQVLEESGASSRIEIAKGRGLSPFVGREEEVYRLLRSWNLAKQGKGQLLLLNGEAGIGKSRLVESLKGQVRQENNVAKLELRCSDYHVNSPFFPLIDLLEKRVLAFEKEEPPESKIDKVVKWMDFAGIAKHPNLPIFADFLSIPISAKQRDQYESGLLGAAGKRKKFIEGFTSALFNFSQIQPLLLIIEDLHWMDSSTLEWLNLTIKQINAYPILILSTTRPYFQPGWAENRFISQINLHRLNANRIEAICYHQTQGKALPTEILQQIKEKTDGVPLFVEELTRMIIESDLLIEKDDHYDLNPAYKSGFALAVPSTLQDSLIARLDNLSGSRTIAQIGAVLGREFSFELLQAVTQKDERSLQQDLDQLVSSELLYQKGFGKEAKYIFKHALIQDTAYQSLLRSKRQQWHQQVVAVLENQFPELVEAQPGIIAHHASEAGLKRKALEMWEKAAHKAVDQSANLDALHHFERAFSLLDSLKNETERTTKELELLVPYMGVLCLAKSWGHPEVKKNGLRILELSELYNNHIFRFSGYYGLGAAHFSNGEFEEALDYAFKGLALAKDIKEMDFRPGFITFLGEINLVMGNLKESLTFFQKAIQLYQPEKHQFLENMGSGDIWFYAQSFLVINLAILGYPDQAKREARAIEERSIGQKNIMSIHRTKCATGILSYFLNNWEYMQQVFHSTLPQIEESGEMALIPAWQLWNCIYLITKGAKKNIQKARRILKQLTELEFIFYQPLYCTSFAEACLLGGHITEGHTVINYALDLCQQTKEKLSLSKLYSIQGDLFIVEDKTDLAEKAFQKAITLAKKQSAKWYELQATISLAKLWHSQGKTKAAFETLNEIYSWFTEGFDTVDMQEANALLEGWAKQMEVDSK